MDIYFNNILRKSAIHLTDMLHPDITTGQAGIPIPAGPEGIYKVPELVIEFDVDQTTFINMMLLRAGTNEADTYTGDIYSEGWLVEYDPE
jgi:hypothetical protein